MNQKPISKEELFKELDYYQSMNCKYTDGNILGSMCTEPHPIAKEVFIKFFESNLGDPGLFKGTLALETKALNLLGSILSIKNPAGHIVTGGTEANLMAMRAIKNIARDEKGITKPEIIVPKSAHFSFKKAQDMLGFKLIEGKLDENYSLDIDFVENSINENTIAIVGIAGTTELGMIDPIPQLSDLAVENDIHLHVDAAFGGFSIPFLKNIGFDLPDFDFSLPGVKSMTVDPHKMGLAPIPAGGILFRDKHYLDAMSVDSPYLTVKHQSTIVGTRVGATSAATYAVMRHLGIEGYTNRAKEAMDKSLFLSENLKKLGYNLVVEPKLNIVAFNHPNIETDDFANILEDYGWRTSCSSYPKAIRVIVTNHLTHNNLVDFLKDLEEIMDKF